MHSNVDSFKFTDWMIAFNVNLELCNHAALPGVDPEWRESFVRSRFSSYTGGDLMHLHLDLQCTRLSAPISECLLMNLY